MAFVNDEVRTMLLKHKLMTLVLSSICLYSPMLMAKPATEKTVNALFETALKKGIFSNHSSMMPQVLYIKAEADVKNVLGKETLNEQDKEFVKQYHQKIVEMFDEMHSSELFIDMLKKYYMQVFTEEELVAFHQFIKQDVGVSFHLKFLNEFVEKGSDKMQPFFEQYWSEGQGKQRNIELLEMLFKYKSAQ